MDKLEELKGRLADLTQQAKDIRDLADTEKRDMNQEEAEKLDKIFAEFEATEGEITRLTRIADMTARAEPQAQPRRTDPAAIANANTPTAAEQARQAAADAAAGRQRQPNGLQNTNVRSLAERGRWGWNTMGDFARAVILASAPGQQNVDPRLLNAAPTSYGSEGSGADGGFAVPPDFRTAIMTKIMGEDSLLSRTDQLTSSSNQIVLPVDETAPWDSTAGIQGYWLGEGQQKPPSKPALGQQTTRLNKLAALVPVTDELREDAPGLEAYLRKKVGEVFDFKISFAIVQGTGVGQPLGVLNSPATVVQTKESGQAADTIVYQNLLNMWTRMNGPSRQRAIWLVNAMVEAVLPTLAFPVKNVAGTENVGGWPVYMPAGGISGSPFAQIFGRPVIPSQTTEVLGDKGDIIFGDFSQYMTVLKGGGIREDVSMHLWFDYDITAFRFVIRIGGRPWWSTAISPRVGTATLGAFVTLEAR